MKQDDILQLLENALELKQGALHPGDVLSELAAWDSMSPLVVMAMADSHLNRNIAPKEVQQCKTVADLLRLLDVPVA
jgi:acyl carrier protein